MLLQGAEPSFGLVFDGLLDSVSDIMKKEG